MTLKTHPIAVVAAAALALAWTTVTIASAQTTQVSKDAPTAQRYQKVTPPAASAQSARRGANALTGVRATTVAPLTSGECVALGGAVKDTYVRDCASGKYCQRTDQYGRIHRMCVSLGG
jgi:hypothetical protein